MQDLLQGSRFGTLMFLLYMVVVFFILLAMFVTIITEAFAAVCDDASKQSNEYEMVDFMIDRFKHWTGLSGLLNKFDQGNGELNGEKVLMSLILFSVQIVQNIYRRTIAVKVHLHS